MSKATERVQLIKETIKSGRGKVICLFGDPSELYDVQSRMVNALPGQVTTRTVRYDSSNEFWLIVTTKSYERQVLMQDVRFDFTRRSK